MSIGLICDDIKQYEDLKEKVKTKITPGVLIPASALLSAVKSKTLMNTQLSADYICVETNLYDQDSLDLCSFYSIYRVFFRIDTSSIFEFASLLLLRIIQYPKMKFVLITDDFGLWNLFSQLTNSPAHLNVCPIIPSERNLLANAWLTTDINAYAAPGHCFTEDGNIKTEFITYFGLLFEKGNPILIFPKMKNFDVSLSALIDLASVGINSEADVLNDIEPNLPPFPFSSLKTFGCDDSKYEQYGNALQALFKLAPNSTIAVYSDGIGRLVDVCVQIGFKHIFVIEKSVDFLEFLKLRKGNDWPKSVEIISHAKDFTEPDSWIDIQSADTILAKENQLQSEESNCSTKPKNSQSLDSDINLKPDSKDIPHHDSKTNNENEKDNKVSSNNDNTSKAIDASNNDNTSKAIDASNKNDDDNPNKEKPQNEENQSKANDELGKNHSEIKERKLTNQNSFKQETVRVIEGEKVFHSVDIMVVDSTGVFGYNYFYPDLYHYMKPDGIAIPRVMTSSVIPIMSQRLWSQAKNLKRMHKISTVNLRTAFFLSSSQEAYGFATPMMNEPCSDRILEFTIQIDGICHGFAGWTCAQLFQEIKITTEPTNMTSGLKTWPTVFLPIEQPVPVSKGSIIRAIFSRRENEKGIWLEWAIVHPLITPIQNGGACGFMWLKQNQ